MNLQSYFRMTSVANGAKPNVLREDRSYPLQFDNEDVAIWKTVVPQNASTVMHARQRTRVTIGRSGET
jgi:hypothetical protein